jgi:group II intron reverse transcriptase/maturase
MLEDILSKDNMTSAYRRVLANKGASGVDGMKASELQSYLQDAWIFVKSDILEGIYEPQGIRRVEIPKSNGGKRQLGIPTVLDRLIQQGIGQQLSLLYDEKFSENSYGFRPGRSTHQCVKQGLKYVNSGYTYIIDLDLSNFFDRVNHDYLISLLSKEITDKRLLRLIGKYLRAGIMIGGVQQVNQEGMPQGSPLSPILSNIVLDVLDKELEKRGHKFVRYADDFSIYCRSKRAAERVMKSISAFVESVLHLQINTDKSGIRRPSNMFLLGFGFYPKSKGVWALRISPKSVKRLKQKIKQQTKRSRTQSTSHRIEQINLIIRGWIQYFKIANCKTLVKELDEWIRSRLRMCEWKLWKRVRTRIKRLKELGVNQQKAIQWANTRKGYWKTAHSPILNTTLNNQWFEQKGYISLSKIYAKIKQPS